MSQPSLTLRQYSQNDFPLVAKWWHDHYKNDFRPGFAPACSFITLYEGECSGFFGMCLMAPDFCYLAFPLVNPALEKEKRALTIDFIIHASKLWAAQANIPIVYISTHGESFLNRLGNAGFIADGSNNTHLFCKVGNIA